MRSSFISSAELALTINALKVLKQEFLKLEKELIYGNTTPMERILKETRLSEVEAELRLVEEALGEKHGRLE